MPTKKSAPAKKTSPKRTKDGGTASSKRPIRREVGSLLFFLGGIIALLGLFGNDALLVKWLCGGVKYLFGYGFWFFCPAFFVSAVVLLFHRGRPVLLRTVCVNILPVLLGIMLHMFTRGAEPTVWSGELPSGLLASGLEVKSGGLICGLIGEAFYSLMGKTLTVIVILLGITAALFVMLHISPVALYDRFRVWMRREYEPEELPEASSPPPSRQARKTKASPPPLPANSEDKKIKERREETFNTLRQEHRSDEPAPSSPGASGVTELFRATRKSVSVPAYFNSQPEEEADDASLPEVPQTPIPPPEPPATEPPSTTPTEQAPPSTPAPAKKSGGKTSEAPPSPPVRTVAVIEDSAPGADFLLDPPPYQPPPLSLLRTASAGPGSMETAEEMQRGAARLLDSLQSFNVGATITNVVRGPSVARYELELESGTKLASLTNLSNDIALALGVDGVNISPVQNKANVVGVEVPNRLVSTVNIRSIVESPEFAHSATPTTFVLGRDIGGQNIIADIRKLTHLLIAGTTGSGKSVCMNSLITSLLYKASPEDLRFIMVDPKVIELAVYNGIPHLLTPVVTDPRKAAEALNWAVSEMESRYALLLSKNQRDIDSYNEAVRNDEGGKTLPRIIIIIDEMADLMMVAKKEIETSIARIAQKARACGVHLILATQRPQAQVVTGIIKANIPSRIAFAVNSNLDSRIILDTGGAEKLVGRGDMLYLPVGAMRPNRIQGCLITTEEVNAIVGHIKESYTVEYDEQIQKQLEADSNREKPDSVPMESMEDDPMFAMAVDAILEAGQGSTSFLQRRLKLGFARAGRLMDMMEQRGVVGPSEGARPRQLLITREEWEEKGQAISGGDD